MISNRSKGGSLGRRPDECQHGFNLTCKTPEMGSIRMKFAGILVIAATVLSGCSTDTGEDGRIGENFTSPLVEPIEALSSGNSEQMCSHLKSIGDVDCDLLVAPSGNPLAIEPSSQLVPSGELFTFQGDGFLLEILRTDLDTDEGLQRIWSIETFETLELEFPYGGEYMGKAVPQGTTLKLLPGDLDETKVSSNVDDDGLWTGAPVKSSSGVEFVFEPAVDLEDKIQEKVGASCAAYADSLTVEALLPNDPFTPAFLQSGQEPGARGVAFVYGIGDAELKRTINYPEINFVADCEILAVKPLFPEVIVEISIPKVVVGGDVDYQSGISPFGVYQFGFLPRTLQSSFLVQASVVFGESGTSNRISYGPLSQNSPWIISEPIPDATFFGGRNSG